MNEYQKTYNSFSGSDIVASVDLELPDGTKIYQVIGSLATISYSTYMDKRPVRSIGNVNAKDYVFGPRTIAGSLAFTVFNKHWLHEAVEAAGLDSSVVTYMVDELPPMNITISLANEYGAESRQALYGVRICSEGQVISANDVYTENTYQFFATGIDLMSSSSPAGKRSVSAPTTITTAETNTSEVVVAVPKTPVKTTDIVKYKVGQTATTITVETDDSSDTVTTTTTKLGDDGASSVTVETSTVDSILADTTKLDSILATTRANALANLNSGG